MTLKCAKWDYTLVTWVHAVPCVLDLEFSSYKARVRHFQDLCSQTRQKFEDGVTIFFGTEFVASYQTAQRMVAHESCSTELSFVLYLPKFIEV